jgi:hypothetical protein
MGWVQLMFTLQRERKKREAEKCSTHRDCDTKGAELGIILWYRALQICR